MINPINTTQTSDVGSHQTMEAFRAQRIPTKDISFLRLVIGFLVLLAIAFGISRIGSIERTKEFSGELIRDGQSYSGTLVLTHTIQDKVLGFTTLTGQIQIYSESGKELAKIPLSDYSNTGTGYLFCSPSSREDTDIYFDAKLEQLAIVTPTYIWISADPEFLDPIPYFPEI